MDKNPSNPGRHRDAKKPREVKPEAGYDVMAREEKLDMNTRVLFRYLLPVGMIALAVWLFVDGTKFSLYPPNPSIGRTGGCYTDLEIMLGVGRPTWIRNAELLSPLVLLPMTIASWIMLRPRREQKAM